MDLFDREDVTRTLSFLHPGDFLVELRILTEKGTYSGYYSDLDRLIDDAHRWSGRGNCYVTLNRVHPDCASRARNRLIYAKQGSTTKDSEITRRTGLLIDIDPKRLSGIASTDTELESALQLAQSIHTFLSASGWPEPLFATSGNGAALLYAIDLPPADDGLVKEVLSALAAKFNTPFAEVDTSVHNPARITRLLGTMNCKGDHSPERPHRLARIIDTPETLCVVTREQLESLTGICVAEGEDPYNFDRFVVNNKFDIASWLSRHGVPYKTEELSKGGQRYRLDVCPTKGPGHEDGRTWIDQYANGRISAGCFHSKCREVNWAKIRSAIDPTFDENVERAVTNGAIEKPHNCHRLARTHLEATQTADGISTYSLLGDSLYQWKTTRWHEMSAASIQRTLTRAIKSEVDRIAAGSRQHGVDAHAIEVTTAFVNNVRNALLSMIPAVDDKPSWLDDKLSWSANEMLACSDRLIHLPSFAIGKADYALPLSPRLFTTLNLGYPFVENCAEPAVWNTFLDQVFPNDAESIALLQEWFGYLLTADTRYQKMLVMFGPGGGGKGTILHVAQNLIGKANVASLKLATLGESHALEALVGKSLCVFPDAAISAKKDCTSLVEMVKSIVGEDVMSINPKNRPRFSAKLDTRLMVATNDLLALPDSSGALARRLLVLRFTKRFTDAPDVNLRDKLDTELPGILLWAIHGWVRLRRNGKFTEPASAKEVFTRLNETSSPIRTFVAERCIVDQRGIVDKDDLFADWREWCAERDYEAGDKNKFCANLYGVAPTIGTHRPRVEGGRLTCFKGIALIDEASAQCVEPHLAHDSKVIARTP